LPPDLTPSIEVVFFVDRSLGGRIVVDALRNAGAYVIAHDDRFAADTPDVEWLSEAGQRNWLVLTKDSAIRRNPHEKAMIRNARVRVFALTRKDLRGQEMAEIFVAALPGMLTRTAKVAAPFVFSISKAGVFQRLD